MNVVKQHSAQLRAMSDSRIAWNSANLLERLAELLAVANCPECIDNSGAYAKEVAGYDGEPDFEMVQCRWCTEKEAYLKDDHT